MAMDALLVTAEPEIDLEDLDPLAVESVATDFGDLFFKHVHRCHSIPPLDRKAHQQPLEGLDPC